MPTSEQWPLDFQLLTTLAAGTERQQRVKRLQIMRQSQEMQCCLCLSGKMRRPRRVLTKAVRRLLGHTAHECMKSVGLKSHEPEACPFSSCACLHAPALGDSKMVIVPCLTMAGPSQVRLCCLRRALGLDQPLWRHPWASCPRSCLLSASLTTRNSLLTALSLLQHQVYICSFLSLSFSVHALGKLINAHVSKHCSTSTSCDQSLTLEDAFGA